MSNAADALSDTQLLILNNASSHENKSILPHAKSMKSFGAALNKAITGLVSAGYLKRDDHIGHGEASMKDEKGAHTYRITKAGLKVIHEEDDTEMAKNKKPTEQEKADSAKAEAIADKAKENIESNNPGISDAATNSIEDHRKIEDIDHTVHLEGDTPEKKIQRDLLKTKQDFIKTKSEEADALEADLKEKSETLKNLRKDIRETQKDAANVIFNITGVKPKGLAGRPKSVKAPGDKAIGRAPSISVRGKRILVLKPDAPMRDGSLRSSAWKIIIDNPGLTYEEYRKQGGREGDLKFFVLKEFVKVEFPKAVSEEAAKETSTEENSQTTSEEKAGEEAAA